MINRGQVNKEVSDKCTVSRRLGEANGSKVHAPRIKIGSFRIHIIVGIPKTR